ncbi:ACP S-malonyltransferase [Pseudogulbenkiania ferrooxidans]|uniref:Malonyl CoA-acyl carrier protein transacylase n=1 Tax=Pseudogulbenkiania ferrooxidans 2002 TaxID=279714 RepID=B9Z6T4_9NEIS|nr:ACP S-malonyltransferase [Pseudogulbenkiania ferrooxidans]EEG07659.1 malonyl CoA-acyl carrier protein transacylase [Pseudogulbenkiania ferrooxidans 2002]
MSFAFVFPGQGSQSLNMMDGFADLPVVKQTFDEASAVLGDDLWTMLKAESADAINATVNTQPLMLAAGVATWRAWLAVGGALPVAVAGHSLGEYSALVAAGALGFADAVKLVRLRAQAMQEAVPAGEGAMAAILNLSDDDIRAACAEAAQGEVVEAVNFNSPGQVVIAGAKAAVERAMELCKAKGAKRALPLPVSVPSHCALMKPAAERLAAALAEVEIKAPSIPVLHNADVASYSDPAQIRDALVRQLYSPVRWTETVQKLAADGVLQLAECGPGKVLAGLAKRIDGNVKGLALTDAAALQAACEELK